MTTSTVSEITAVTEEALRAGFDSEESLESYESDFIISTLNNERLEDDYAGSDFLRVISVLAFALRQKKDGPLVVIGSYPEVTDLVASLHDPIARLSRHLGSEITIHSRPYNADKMADIDPKNPILVAVVGSVTVDDPSELSSRFGSWLLRLPRSVPVIRWWQPPRRKRRVHQGKSIDQPLDLEIDETFDELFGPDATMTDTFELAAELGISTSIVTPVPHVQQPRREKLSLEIAAHLVREDPSLIAVTGRPGTGRTMLLNEVEVKVRLTCPELTVIRLQPHPYEPTKALFSEVERIQAEGAEGTVIIVIDDLDFAARLDTRSPDLTFLESVSVSHRTGVARFLLVLDDALLEKLDEFHHELADSLHRIDLPELPPSDQLELVGDAVSDLAESTGLDFDPSIVESALLPAQPKDSLAHPGLALSRIDAAIGRARVERTETVRSEHMGPELEQATPRTAEELSRRLNENVCGQDRAVTLVAERLAPSLAGLKLRPERPHGVFLFAGPTGVGKTEMAKQLAHVVYGSHDALIRIDMSEYSDHQDARMKLIGASRTWKNSTTEGLLTTRVREMPRSVVLLDEFEKSHPLVWPLFLQIFDEGRLTDGWGYTADFSETVIIMTSNLGVREGNARAAGFGAAGGFDSDRQRTAIADELPPEFLNRITATVGFDQLSREAIRELAEMELRRITGRLNGDGWHIDYDAEVVDRLAATGYDPSCGARHLQRNIERELFPLLSKSPTRRLRVGVDTGGLSISPQPLSR